MTLQSFNQLFRSFNRTFRSLNRSFNRNRSNLYPKRSILYQNRDRRFGFVVGFPIGPKSTIEIGRLGIRIINDSIHKPQSHYLSQPATLSGCSSIEMKISNLHVKELETFTWYLWVTYVLIKAPNRACYEKLCTFMIIPKSWLTTCYFSPHPKVEIFLWTCNFWFVCFD